MEGRTTIAATVKGMEDVKAWFDKKEQQERSSRAVKEAFEEAAAISIRVSQATQQQQQQQQELFTTFGRKNSEVSGVGDMGGDGEEYDDAGKTFCCFPSSRGRRYSRRKAVAYGMEEPQESPSDPNKGLRPLKSLWALCSCCGSARTSSMKWVVEVRGVGVVQEKELGSSAGRWEMDVNEDDYFKPAPMWKQLVRKMKAQARHVQAAGSRNESWLNYDPQSYQKNFDNGEFRQQTYYVRHSLDEENSDNQHAAKEAALHTALLQKIASIRSQQEANTQVVPKLPAAA